MFIDVSVLFIVVFEYILIYNVEFRVWLICDPFFFFVCVLQSKEIGIQMHEELVKVTNELYTVSIMSLNLSLFIFPSLFFSLPLNGALTRCVLPCTMETLTLWPRTKTVWLRDSLEKKETVASHSFLLKDGKLNQGIFLRK